MVFTLAFSMFLMGFQTKQAQAKSSDEQKIQQIISKMTLEQKAQLVIGTGMFFEMPDSLKKMMPPGFGGEGDTKDPVYSEMVKRIRKYLPGAAGNSSEFPELGIATQVLSDGPAGLRIQPTRKGDSAKPTIVLLSQLVPFWPHHGILNWFTKLVRLWEAK